MRLFAFVLITLLVACSNEGPEKLLDVSTPMATTNAMPTPTSSAMATAVRTPTSSAMATAVRTPTSSATATAMPTEISSSAVAPTRMPTATPEPVYAAAWYRLDNAHWVEANDPTLAKEIKDLPWVQDGISESEFKALREFLDLATLSRNALWNILEMGWVMDGVGDKEAETIDLVVSFIDDAIAVSVTELPWVEDGVDELEGKAIQSLIQMSYDDATIAASVIALPWVEDGISKDETRAIELLGSFPDRDMANRLLSMPFLGTLEVSDVAALESLNTMASSQDYKEEFRLIMSHRTLSDGITDEWAKVVATLDSIIRTDSPDLLQRSLSPSSVNVESRTIHLPLTGETSVALVRVGVQGSAESIQLLEDVLVELEAVMEIPLPSPFVGVLIADGGWFGHNSGTHIAIDPQYDDNPDADYGLRHLLTHEVSHYYWRGNDSYIDEGISNTLADAFELRVSGRDIFRERNFEDCGATIQDLDLRANVYRFCHAHLGTQLFMDLYQTLGEQGFREGLRKLYMLSLAEKPAEIQHVRTAFADISKDASETMAIIDRWYLGESGVQ